MNFFSNGKLLITGEYLVLDGAKALAIPTAYGQSLKVSPTTQNNKIKWSSFNADGTIWFEAELHKDKLTARASKEDNLVAKRIYEILSSAKKLNTNFLTSSKGIHVKTKLSFDRNWGLGSSSTFINNIAQWAEVDAYELLDMTFGGSGYDIACAKYNTPILFQRINEKPEVEEVTFDPPFSKHLYFVYLNKKQRSDQAVKRYRDISINKRKGCLASINKITERVLNVASVEQFNTLIIEHENIISTLLNQQPIMKKFFNDFDGAIKSLGAWGGDFVLVCCEQNPRSYFEAKGYSVVIPFKNMIK